MKEETTNLWETCLSRSHNGFSSRADDHNGKIFGFVVISNNNPYNKLKYKGIRGITKSTEDHPSWNIRKCLLSLEKRTEKDVENQQQSLVVEQSKEKILSTSYTDTDTIIVHYIHLENYSAMAAIATAASCCVCLSQCLYYPFCSKSSWFFCWLSQSYNIHTPLTILSNHNDCHIFS